MKRLMRFRYPKLALLLLIIIASYVIFSKPEVTSFIGQLGHLHYIGIFLAGLLIAFGFSAPAAVGFLVVLNYTNLSTILLMALIGGLGAMIGDILIFKFIKLSFMDEFKRIENTKLVKEVHKSFDTHVSHRFRHYLIYIFADLILLTPLPDEFAMTMLAGLTKIKPFYLGIMSFILHFTAILILLLL